MTPSSLSPSSPSWWLSKLAWHGIFWGGVAGTISIAKTKLSTLCDEREHDSLAAESIIRYFDCSWEEGQMLKKSLFIDLHRKLDGCFSVDDLMLQLESITGGSIDEVRGRKLAIWEHLKIEVISRIIVTIYSSLLLEEFLAIAMALVGKALYRWSLLGDYLTVASEDIAVANRIFVCIAARFVQNGSLLLAEAVKNSTKAVFSKVSLQEPTSKLLLDSLFGQVRYEIEAACGKNILDDVLFGKLEEMVSADLSPIRRKLFIGLVTEARKHVKSEKMKRALFNQVTFKLTEIIEASLSSSSTTNSTPFISIFPKIGKHFHQYFTKPPSPLPSSADKFENELKRISALVFVDSDSDVCDILLYSVKARQ